MIRIAVCDDMKEFLDSASALLSEWRGGEAAVSLFNNGDALIEAHLAKPFDIILLDVIMPILGGIETAAELRRSDRSVKLVFLTSSPEFAVDSYRVKANDYLLKPVKKEQLYSCLDELCTQIKNSSKFIFVKDGAVTYRVELRELEYVEAQGKQVMFALSDGSAKNSTEPFYVCEKKLLCEYGFLKCHRSYIVNTSHIKAYTPKEITMSSGQRIPISRNVQKDFEASYFEITFGKAGDVL